MVGFLESKLAPESLFQEMNSVSGFSANSPFQFLEPAISFALLRYRSDGTLDRLRRKWLTAASNCDKKTGQNEDSILGSEDDKEGEQTNAGSWSQTESSSGQSSIDVYNFMGIMVPYFI